MRTKRLVITEVKHTNPKLNAMKDWRKRHYGKKTNDNDFIKRMTIELVDDVRVTASAKSDIFSVQIICVEIEILD